MSIKRSLQFIKILPRWTPQTKACIRPMVTHYGFQKHNTQRNYTDFVTYIRASIESKPNVHVETTVRLARNVNSDSQ